MKKRPAWRFTKLDTEYPSGLDPRLIPPLLKRLTSFESMTWAEIDSSRRSHTWESPDPWAKPARARWAQLNLDDVSSIYQLHISGKARLYGYRQGEVFNVIWYDYRHEVYPTKKKNT